MSRLACSLLSVLDWLFRIFLSQLCLRALWGFSEQHQGSSALRACGCFFYSVPCMILIVFFFFILYFVFWRVFTKCVHANPSKYPKSLYYYRMLNWLCDGSSEGAPESEELVCSCREELISAQNPITYRSERWKLVINITSSEPKWQHGSLSEHVHTHTHACFADPAGALSLLRSLTSDFCYGVATASGALQTPSCLNLLYRLILARHLAARGSTERVTALNRLQ